MLKWVRSWSEATTLKSSLEAKDSIVWAVEMPTSYPECRVTRQGIANIAVTDEEAIASGLREDGGEAKILP